MMMQLSLFRFAACCLSWGFVTRQVVADIDSCTTIGVTAGASADGSTMVTHTSDCAQCDSRVAYIPPRDWPAGTKRPIYAAKLDYPREVSNRSETYFPVYGQSHSVAAGYIPEVDHTYGYWEAVYGYMNEHGLSLGESTAATKDAFVVPRKGLKALMWIRPLTEIAMERCKTARCAIRTMGGISEKFGFYGEDPGPSGSGEALLIIDGKEVWDFEITANVEKTGAFWVAKRVPEGHVTVVANNFVIREVDCSDEENFMCSPGLTQEFKRLGLWNGRGKLDWMMTVSPDLRHFSYTEGFPPIPMYTTGRLWRVFTRVAPSCGVKLTNVSYDLPFSVKAEAPITHRFLMDLKRDHYEGTEIDLTVGPMAGPFGSPNRIEGGIGLQASGGQFARAISLPRTSYCAMGHTFGEATQSGRLNKLWFATDTPASSVFVPFFAAADTFDESYRRGHMGEYDDKSAWWVFDFLANWMDINYRLMSRDVTAKINEIQDAIDKNLTAIEGAADTALTLSYTQTRIQETVVNMWRDFGRLMIVKYNDGRDNYPKVAQTIGYPAWWLQTFGLNADIHPKWSQPSATPPAFYTEYGPGPYEKINFKTIVNSSFNSSVVSADTPKKADKVASPHLRNYVQPILTYGAIFALGWVLCSLKKGRKQGEVEDPKKPLLANAA